MLCSKGKCREIWRLFSNRAPSLPESKPTQQTGYGF
jgi:hypothetical protein